MTDKIINRYGVYRSYFGESIHIHEGKLILKKDNLTGLWGEVKKEENKLTHEEYFNIIDSIPFFKDIVTRDYTICGCVPVKLVWVNGDTKVMRFYRFVNKDI